MDELFEKIIIKALKQNVSDIHFYFKETLTIKMRCLGQLEIFKTLSYEEGERLMNYIKYKSSINTNYRLLAQTGSFSIHIMQKKYDLRVSFLPTLNFESIVVRILNNRDIKLINAITYQEEVKDYLSSIVKSTSGLFLVSGPTGSGKSTTLYTLLNEIICLKSKNIITIEDPIEIHLNDCLQIELNEKMNINYHNTLKQILRHDPDVIMIGEIRDETTAKLAITCALTGHLVFSTIHASNALLTLKRLLNLGVQSLDLEDVLIGVLSQKMKYDLVNKKAFVLSELLNRCQIKQYITQNSVSYSTFKEEALKLINLGFNKNLFEEELYE